MRPHIIEALQHRKASKRCGDSHSRKVGMPSGWERTAVIHRRRYGDSGRHLVVKQSAGSHSQRGSKLVVGGIVVPAGVRVDACCERAFELFKALLRLVNVAGHNRKRRVAEGFGLEDGRVGKELICLLYTSDAADDYSV